MLLIIDGHSIAYRVYYKTPKLTNSSGVPTSVIHTFLNILISLKEKWSSDEITVVFDSKGETERHQITKEYKANRQPAPEDLIPQIEILKEIIPEMGIKVISKQGVEADDIIYTLTEDTESPTYIITKDKDLHQLINDNVKIYDYQNEEIIDAAAAEEKFGIKPSQIPDYLALVGDSSDNIPGIKGIGPKTAAPLLQKYLNLDGIYNNLQNIKENVSKKLEKYHDDAYLSKKLAEPIKTELTDTTQSEYKHKSLQELLEKYELRKIQERLSNNTKSVSLNEKAVENPMIAAYVDDDLYIADTVSYCKQSNPVNFSNIKYVFSYKNIYKNSGRSIKCPLDLELMSWMNDPDNGGLKKQKDEDTGTFLNRLTHEAENIYDEFVKNDFEDVYNQIEVKTSEVLAKMESSGIKLSSEMLAKVNSKLSDELQRIQSIIYREIDREINLNSPKQLSDVLFNGLGIKPYKKTKTGYSTNEESLKNLIGLNPAHKNLLENILQHREMSKLKNTYTSKLGDYINDKTGRIHSTFNQTGTATGRLSSSNPNLQNIPQKGDIAAQIRSTFIPEEGYSFISFDYSQIELRILAELSRDDTLLNAYKNNEDIHTKTASMIFEKSENDIDENLRRIAKSVNFGIIYGLSPYGLARDTGVSQKEAKRFIEKYFELYPKVDKYIKSVIQNSKINGFTETIFGRKRFVKDLLSRNKALSSRAERIAINAPIQGTSADIIKKAMVDTSGYLKDNNIDGRVVLQVHDELIFEVNDNCTGEVFEKLKNRMENVIHLSVPMTVHGAVGKNLGELK